LDGISGADSFTAESSAYFDALIADLEAQVAVPRGEAPESEISDKIVLGCFTTLSGCEAAGVLLVIRRAIIGFDCRVPTTTCGRRVALLA
jgi:hypothetical protein